MMVVDYTMLRPEIAVGRVSLWRIKVAFLVGVTLSALAIGIAIWLLALSSIDPDFRTARTGLAGIYGLLPLTIYIWIYLDRDDAEKKIAKGRKIRNALLSTMNPQEFHLLEGGKIEQGLLILRDQDDVLMRLNDEDSLRISRKGSRYFISRILMNSRS